MRRFYRNTPFAVVVLLLLAAALPVGCNRNARSIVTEKVTGTISLDGTPVGGAMVQFEPKSPGIGESAAGHSDGKGFYALSSINGNPGAGAVQGDYTVTISRMVDTKLPKPKFNPGRGEMVDSELQETFPARYLSKESTPFSVTVKRGKNVFDFNVESK